MGCKHALWEILLPEGANRGPGTKGTLTGFLLPQKATPEPYEWSYELRESDPYWQAAIVAWRRIAEHACLPGAMRWVEKFNTALYRELMEELPGEIDRLWDSGVPIPRFQAVLNCWVEAHQKAVDLYSVRRRGKLVKNGEPCKGRGEL